MCGFGAVCPRKQRSHSTRFGAWMGLGWSCYVSSVQAASEKEQEQFSCELDVFAEHAALDWGSVQQKQ